MKKLIPFFILTLSMLLSACSEQTPTTTKSNATNEAASSIDNIADNSEDSLSMLLSACSEQTPTTTESNATNEATSSMDNTADNSEDSLILECTVDNVTYTISKCEFRSIIGDRNAENFMTENGTHFAKGGDILPVDEWKELVVTMQISNATEQAFGYIKTCDFTMEDGYVLEQNLTLSDLDLNQIPSNSVDEIEYSVLVENSLNHQNIIFEYAHLDYSKEYWDDFGKIIKGEIGEKEYLEKYTTEPLSFMIPIPLS